MAVNSPEGRDLAGEAVRGLEPAQLDGHTVDELVDYLDSDMTPPNPSIDRSPACQNALAAIARLRFRTDRMLTADASASRRSDDRWVSDILANISMEAHAGRSIALTPIDEAERPTITEGALRALVRHAADAVGGILVGRCTIDGDVETLGAPVRIGVTVTLVWGQPIRDVADRVRTAVQGAVGRHTDLDLVAVDVRIRDLHVPLGEERP
jgi:hypothetical protein